MKDAGSGRRDAGEIALGAASAGEQIVQGEKVAKGAKDGGDMAMRKRAKDLKGLLAGDQILALESATQEIDLSGGPGGEIGEGALVDFGADADRFAEKDGRGKSYGWGRILRTWVYDIR